MFQEETPVWQSLVFKLSAFKMWQLQKIVFHNITA